MKTEQEIRRHRDNLRTLISKPCGCAGTVHELKCFIGGQLMVASVATLDWALGETAEHDGMVERMAASAQEFRLTGGMHGA